MNDLVTTNAIILCSFHLVFFIIRSIVLVDIGRPLLRA
jgi:hypothetical protein